MTQYLDAGVLSQFLGHPDDDLDHVAVHSTLHGIGDVPLVNVVVRHDTVYDRVDGSFLGIFFVSFRRIRSFVVVALSGPPRTYASHRECCLNIKMLKEKIYTDTRRLHMRVFLDSILLLADNLGAQRSLSSNLPQPQERSRIYVRRPDAFSERIGLKNGAIATLEIVLEAATPGTPQFRYFGMNRKRSQDTALQDVRGRIGPVLARRSPEESEACMSQLIAEHPCIMAPVLSGILNRRVTVFFGPRAKDMCDFGSANTSSYGLIILIACHMADDYRFRDEDIVTLEWSGTARDRDCVIDRIIRKYGVSSRAASKMNLKIM